MLHFPQTRSPLSHSSGGNKPSPRHANADRSAYFPQGREARLEEDPPVLRQERVGVVNNPMPAQNTSRSTSARTVD